MNMGSGKVLDVDGLSTSDGAGIQQWDYLGGENQQWRLVPLGGNFSPGGFKIVNRLSGKVLDDTGDSLTSGTIMQQWTDLGGANQQWLITPVQYQIIASATAVSLPGVNVSVQFPEVLDVPGGSTANGTVVQLWSYNGFPQQQWPSVPQPDGSVAILNRLTHKALEVSGSSPANGAAIDQSDFTGAANQKWSEVYQFGPNPSVFAIVNQQSGSALDNTGFSLVNGTHLQQWTSTGAANQFWIFLPVLQ